MNKRVLYADDDEMGREMMEAWISTAELRVDLLVSDSVKQTKELLQRSRFDLLLLDYCFADGTGIDICKTVRQMGSNVPVIFYSAIARNVDRQNASDAGGSAYFVKPDDLDKLLPIMRHLLGGERIARLAKPIRFRAARGIL